MARINLLRAIALAIAFSVPAVAQQIVGGSYKVTQMNGDPVRPGVDVVTVLVPPIFGDLWAGFVFVNGNVIEDECFSMIVRGGVGYWINGRGTEGHIDANGNGTLTSTVDTGPNQGTQRLMSS